MDLTNLLNAYPGIHVVQAFLHSVSAAIIAHRAILDWNIRSPVIRQKFHLIAVFGPVVSYPLYQWINPDRGSVDFRPRALFDSESQLASLMAARASQLGLDTRYHEPFAERAFGYVLIWIALAVFSVEGVVRGWRSRAAAN